MFAGWMDDLPQQAPAFIYNPPKPPSIMSKNAAQLSSDTSPNEDASGWNFSHTRELFPLLVAAAEAPAVPPDTQRNPSVWPGCSRTGPAAPAHPASRADSYNLLPDYL